MAATESSSDAAAVKSLREEGFVDLHDLKVGEHVLEMQQNRFDFLSLYGLEYCNLHIIGNPV
jgi:hypothetical protein